MKQLLEAYERESTCGYDEAVGMAAIARLITALNAEPLIEDPQQYVTAVVDRFLSLFNGCTLRGELSSGRSSMGSALYRIANNLPPSMEHLQSRVYVALNG